MRPVPLVVAVAAVLGGAPALAAPPTMPSDLRVDVYSGTAAELFWSRSTDPDGFVGGYEIRRDGQLVDTRDGLSYFTDDLTNGRAFAFTVTAVDFDGERSAPASVSVVGGDRDGVAGSGGGRPPPPANLRSEVYSSSAAEVFWDRTDRRGLSYEVVRNGETVATTNGTSAFLSGLPRTNGETIDVVAIDADGQRSGAATVTLGGASGGDPMEPVTPPSGDDAPAAPSNLRAELYSSSAGEVFWDRVSGTRLSYEVILDGEVVATTTGTSYFAGGREGLDGTRVQVVAIGSDGSRSAASGTTLGDAGTTNPDPEPGMDVPPPANARIEVYSGTAAELFWDRPPAAANVDVARVRRDGTSIGTTAGTSFFDAGRQPGRDYRYEITFVGAGGTESAPTTIGDTGTSGGTLLGDEGAPRRLLPRLLAVAAGEPIDAFLDRVALPEVEPSLIETPPSGLTFTGLSNGADSSEIATYDCDAGGSLTVTVGAAIQDRTVEYDADDCLTDGTTHDGTYVTRDARAANDRSFRGPLELVSETVSATGIGSLNRSFATALPNGRLTREADELRFDAGPLAGLALSDYRTVSTYDDAPPDGGDPTKTLSTSFTVTAPWTDGQPLEVRTSRGFGDYDSEVGAYGVGTLEVRAPDGPSWRLILATGDAETFVLEIIRERATSTLGLRWSDEFNLPCLASSDPSGTAAVQRRCEALFGAPSDD